MKRKSKRILAWLLSAALSVGTLTASEAALHARAEDDISLMAAEVDTSYSVKGQKTKIFTNISTAEQNAAINQGDKIRGYTYDYIIYYADNTVKEYSYAEVNSTTFTVPAGGRIAVSTSRSMSVSIADDYFFVEDEDAPLYTTLRIPAGESYTVTSISDMPYKIFTKSGTKLDYRIKDASGAHSSRGSVSDTAGLTLPARYSAHITSYSSNSEIGILNPMFTYESADSQVYEAAHVQAGESYVYTNKLDSEMTVSFNYGEKSAYAVFDKDGNVTSTEFVNSSNSTKVPAHGCIKVMCFEPTSWGYLKDMKSFEKLDEDLFTIIPMLSSDTWEFTNTSSNDCAIFSRDYAHFIYVLYDAVGTAKDASGMISYKNTINVPAGYTLKLQCIGSNRNNCYLFALNDVFEVRENSGKLLESVFIAPDETYRAVNLRNKETTIRFGDNRDYTLYDSTNTLTKSGSGYHTNIPANGYAEFTSPNNESSFYHIISGKAEFEKTGAAERTTYKVTNTGMAECSLSSSGYYAYIMYSETGKMLSSSYYTKNSITLPINGYAYITPYYNGYSVDESAALTLEEVKNEPLYQMVHIPAQGTYNFTNTSSVDMNIAVYIPKYGMDHSYSLPAQSTAYGFYDYAVYNADGTIKSAKTKVTDGSLTVPAGCTAAITASGEADVDMSVRYWADLFTAEESDNSAYFRRFMDNGESISVKNNTEVKQDVSVDYFSTSDDVSHDYVIYNSDGSVAASACRASYSSGSLTIPANGSAVVTARSPLILSGINDYFTVSDYDGEAYTYTKIEKGETLLLKNTSKTTESFTLDSYEYNYTIYDDEGKLSSCALEGSISSLKPGESVALTPVKSTLTAITRSGAFEISKRDYPATISRVVAAGEKAVMKNTYHADCSVYFKNYDSGYIDYTLYDSSGALTEEKADTQISSSTSLILQPGGYAEIIPCKYTVIYGPYEAFSSEDVGVKVTGITLSQTELSMTSGGQAILTANVTPSDAANKNVTWTSSNTDAVTVAQTGKVRAVAAGRAVITATTEDGGYTATCTVTVDGGGTDQTEEPATPTDEPTEPTSEPAEPADYPYEITAVRLESGSGEELKDIPQGGSFIADVEFVKNKARNEKDYMFIAVYGADGTLLSLDYAKANFTEGDSFEIGFYIPAQTARIASVKAFVWSSFKDAEPLAESVAVISEEQ